MTFSASKHKYRADIDGLRAFAVLPVVFFHSGITLFQGGFVGVDVFFVISGYVITTRLLEDATSGRFSIVGFYERRVRRIFPALVLVITLTTVLVTVLLLPPQMIDYSRSLVASAAFVSNMYFWRQSGYFDIAAALRPLLHLWSLGVEEQFYIVMPVMVYLAYRLGSRWRLIFWPAFLSSLALSIAVTNSAPTANFFLLPTRAWELLLGALLVLTPPPPSPNRYVAELCAAAGAILLLGSVFLLSEASPFPGKNALFPCIGAALLIYSGSSDLPFCNWIISWKPIVFIGLISYSLYLFHWPLIVITHYYLLREPRGFEIVLLIAASVALAALSYKFLETPFRQKKFAPRRRVLFAQAVAAMAAMLAIGVAGARSGLAWRFPDFEVATVRGVEQWRPGVCFLDGRQLPGAWSADTCTLSKGHNANLLLWGDSFAGHYIPGLLANQSAIPYNIIAYTEAGCPPILRYESYSLPNCHAFNQNALEIVSRMKPKVVILSARWDLAREHGFLIDFQETVDRLKSEGAKVIVVGPSPEYGIDIQSIAYRLRNDKFGSSSWWIANINPALINALGEVSKGATLLDPIKALCVDNRCPYKIDDKLLFVDYGHFSAEGSDWAVKALRLGMDGSGAD